MSIDNILSIGVFLLALVLITPVLGNYMAAALGGNKVFLTPVLGPCERLIYRICMINPQEDMHWTVYARSVFWFSLLGFIVVFALQLLQHSLPLNPHGLPGVPWALALNTAVSFVTNTNWQAYAGESTLSYLTQTLGLSVQNFLSAAVGMAVLLAFIRGLVNKKQSALGNFWVDLTRSFLYVLLPLSLIFSLLLISEGVVQNFSAICNCPHTRRRYANFAHGTCGFADCYQATWHQRRRVFRR